MIDPISLAALSALVGGVISGATGEAGGAAFRRLSELVRRSDPDNDELVERVAAGDVEVAEIAAEKIIGAAESDEDFAHALGAWVEISQAAITDASTDNSIDGTVQGPVVQGRDFSGPINLG